MVDELKEVLEDRRNFVGPDGETDYYIGTPSADDIRNADWQYSRAYTECLKEGITTSAEMMDILRRRGVVGEDFDRRAAELSTILNDFILKLNEAVTSEEKAELAVEVAQAREALFRWNQRLSGPMSNTCEQIADDARLEYITSAIIQDKDGTKVWSDHDTFLKSTDQALTMKARYEVMLFLQGYESDFLEQTPEAQAMKEVEADLIRRATIAAEEEKKKEAAAKKKKAPAKKKTAKAKKDEKTEES